MMLQSELPLSCPELSGSVSCDDGVQGEVVVMGWCKPSRYLCAACVGAALWLAPSGTTAQTLDIAERPLTAALREGRSFNIRRVASEDGERVFHMEARDGRRVATYALVGPDGAVTLATALVATDSRNLPVLRNFATHLCGVACDGSAVMQWLDAQAADGVVAGQRRFGGVLVDFAVAPGTTESVSFIQVTFDATRGAQSLLAEQQYQARLELARRAHDQEISEFESGESGAEQMRTFLERLSRAESLPQDYQAARTAQVSALLAMRLLDAAERRLGDGRIDDARTFLSNVQTLIPALVEEDRRHVQHRWGAVEAQLVVVDATLLVEQGEESLARGDLTGALVAFDLALPHLVRAAPSERQPLEERIRIARAEVSEEQERTRAAQAADARRAQQERDARVAAQLRSPAAAGTLSLVPGLGHAYARRWGAAVGYFVGVSAATAWGGWLAQRSRSLEDTYESATDPHVASMSFDRAQRSRYAGWAFIGVGTVFYLINIVHAVRRTKRWNAALQHRRWSGLGPTLTF